MIALPTYCKGLAKVCFSNNGDKNPALRHTSGTKFSLPNQKPDTIDKTPVYQSIDPQSAPPHTATSCKGPLFPK